MEHFHSQQIPDPLPEKRPIFRQLVREVITTILPAVLLALVVNVFVAEAAEIEAGPSMQPNFYVGYRVMTEKISYHFHEPRRGDVVLVERPSNEGNLIKRVIGLPGETIEVVNGQTFIDGQLLDEPWVKNVGGPGYPPAQIPEGQVFIMGDNRPNSRDSRSFGPVPIETILGRGWFVYWPLEEFQLLP